MRVLRGMLLTGVAATSLMAATAVAQSTDETPPPATSDAGEEVVVTGSYTIDKRIDTATGLGLSVRETPQSVTVVTAQRLIDQDIQTIAETVANTTGVSITEIDDVRNTLRARGFEITSYQLDGVPLSWSLAADAGETIVDVSIYERIEFVRGATGLLTGAGEPSASINLVRKHADSDVLTGYVSAGYSSWDTYRITGDVSTPLNDAGTIRARAVAKYEEGDSFIDLYGNKKTVLYGVLEADLTDNTLLRGGISYQNSDPKGVFWGNLPAFYDDGSFLVWPRSQTTAAEWTYWETTNTNYFVNLNHEFDNGWLLKANYNRLENDASTALLYISGALNEATGGGLTTYPYKSENETAQDSFDVSLSGTYDLFGRAHEFVVGGLYSTMKQDVVYFPVPASEFYKPIPNFYGWDGSYPKPAFSTTPTDYQDVETEQSGFYASTRLNLTDEFKVILGGRLSSWNREGNQYGTDEDYGEDNVFVPYVGLLYDITEDHRLYASYTEIFQPQNFRDRNLELLSSVEGRAYEVGLKSAFLDGRLQTSIALFRIEQDNVAQLDGQIANPVPGGLPIDVYRGADGVTSQGIEVEVIGAITDDWNVSVGFSHFVLEDADDNDVNTDQPRNSFKLFTTYQLPGDLDGITLGAGVRWENETYAVSAAGKITQEAFAIASLMARFEVTEQVSVQANVDNLFDETYFTGIDFYNQYRYGDPRNYSLSLTYDF